ncbi:MAG: delta-60 repeat domain-containing protein [Verrucomicrobiae bacterium]|nr:delta-60 repeat domain-containing protein [Verrucomicrobiae bacterium]
MINGIGFPDGIAHANNSDERTALNESGQVAFAFSLTDGRRGIAIGSAPDSSDPTPPPVPPSYVEAFNPGAAGGFLSWVGTLALQADGKILVGGSFVTLGGQPRSNIGRLNADGTLDAGFDPGANDTVETLLVQEDGRILVGGGFTRLGGELRSRIGRLHADGRVDTAFNPGASGGGFPGVYALTLGPDGSILVGGDFRRLGGEARTNLARLRADGVVDGTFQTAANSEISALALDENGRVLVGGGFTTLGGQARSRIGRLNADGTLDTGFNPGAGSWVNALAVQADGKIVVGGAFTTLGGQGRSRIGRLHSDGTLDADFNPGAAGEVVCLALQVDGKILLGGGFTRLGDQTRQRIGRLHLDGTVDLTWDGAANAEVSALAIQADGKVLVGGEFRMLDGLPRSLIGRLNNTGPATEHLGYHGTRVTWLRGGHGPEIVFASFDHSIDGSTWTELGRGMRVPGGWELPDAVLPAGSLLRARGATVGGSGSQWFVEAVAGVGEIPVDPPLLEPPVIGVARGADGSALSVSLPTIAGRTYTLESKSRLEDPEWFPLTSLVGDGTVRILEDPEPPGATRFYRLRVD